MTYIARAVNAAKYFVRQYWFIHYISMCFLTMFSIFVHVCATLMNNFIANFNIFN